MLGTVELIKEQQKISNSIAAQADLGLCALHNIMTIPLYKVWCEKIKNFLQVNSKDPQLYADCVCWSMSKL